MRACVVGGPGVIRCDEAPDPAPADGRVLVRTLSAALCGSDLHAVYYPLMHAAFPLRPGAPGHEAVGEVVDPGASGLRPGQRVLTVPDIPDAACFAEMQAIPAESCIPLPDDLDSAAAVMAQPLGTVIFGARAFTAAGVPETAAVLGLGAVGLFFAQVLKRAGCGTVLASDPEPSRRALAGRFGVDLTLPAGADFRDAVLDATAGRGVALVVEASGTDAARADAAELVAFDGAVGFFGLPRAPTMDGFPFASLFRKRVRMHATYGTQREPGLGCFRQAIALIRAGAVDVAPLLGRRFALDRIEDAFEAAEHDKASLIKAVIDIDGGRSL